MTDDDIKRLKRLAEQATPGPWRVNMLKQLQRSSIDAARYRLLRRKFADAAMKEDGK